MLYRELGATGEQVSIIGMGGSHLGVAEVGEDAAIRLIHVQKLAPQLPRKSDTPELSARVGASTPTRSVQLELAINASETSVHLTSRKI